MFRRYQTGRFLPRAQPRPALREHSLPAPGSGGALEWPSNSRGNPPAVKVSLLRGHHLAIDGAFIHSTGIQGDVIADFSKRHSGLGIPPCHTRNSLSVDDEVGVVSNSLEFAHCGAGNGLKKLHPAILSGEVVGRRVRGLEYSKSSSRVANHLTSVSNNHAFTASLKSWRPGVIPNRLGFWCHGAPLSLQARATSATLTEWLCDNLTHRPHQPR